MIKGESTCTVYKSNGVGFDRFVLYNVHWQEVKANSIAKTGLTDGTAVVVYVPRGSARLFPNRRLFPCKRLFPGADPTPQTPAKDFLVYGECDFEFDNTNERTVSECMRALQKAYTIHTVMSVDRKLYGLKSLQHIKLTAR